MKLYIKKIREEKEMTLSDLARKAKISKSYLSELENGKKKNASLVTICKIASALGVPAKDLFSCD